MPLCSLQIKEDEMLKDNEYALNTIRKQKIDDRYLITTDQGTWIDLSEDDYQLLIQNKIKENPELFKKLEKKGVILTKNNINNAVMEYRKKYSHLFQGASLHILVPTQRCNQRCIYCHSSVVPEKSEGFDMDEDIAKATVDFIFQSPSPAITIEFQEGDALINWDIVKFITEYAEKVNQQKKKHLGFDIVSNLTKMDHDKLKYLIKHKVGICTSLDGPKEVHDKNRYYFGGGGTYKDLTYWINEIKNHYNYDIQALMVVTRFSLSHYKEIVDEYRKWNFRWIKLRPLSNIGFAKGAWKHISYSAEEYLDYYRKSMEYLMEVNKNQLISERMSEIILLKLHGVWANYTDFQSPCGAGIGQIAYDQWGNIFTCDEGRMIKGDVFKLGHVKTTTYKEAITSSTISSMMAASINEDLICDSCAFKPYCGVCPAHNYSEQGSLIVPIPSNFMHKVWFGMFQYLFRNLIKNPEYKKIYRSWLGISPETKNLYMDEETVKSVAAEH